MASPPRPSCPLGTSSCSNVSRVNLPRGPCSLLDEVLRLLAGGPVAWGRQDVSRRSSTGARSGGHLSDVERHQLGDVCQVWRGGADLELTDLTPKMDY